MAYSSIPQELNFLWSQQLVGSGWGDEEISNGKTMISFLVTHSPLNVQLPRTCIRCIYYGQHFHISGFTVEFLG